MLSHIEDSSHTNMKVKGKSKKHGENIPTSRRDPTSFLPEEPMSYVIKHKKKRKKTNQLDPFGDLNESNITTLSEPVIEMKLDPEVTIKAENIEVELDFNDFADNSGLMVEGPYSEESQEPIVKLEEENKEAVLLTFESIINHTPDEVIAYNEEGNRVSAPKHTCKLCHLVFQSQKTLLMHQKRMHKSFRSSFKHICDLCGMSYEFKNSLNAHIRRKHAPDSSPDDNAERTCEVCALVFKGIHRLRMHMRRKHGSFADSFKYACQDCGLTYDKYRSLLVHRKRKHGKGEIVMNQWYNCPFCPKIFNKRETYTRHIQRKHKAADGDKSNDPDFASRRNETTGEITCSQCPLVFSSINHLKLHMRRKHNALKDDFRLKCVICNLSYDKIESLKRHVRRKHDQNLYCDLCNKQFNTEEAYMNHSHVKVIKECTICGLIFASQGGLAKHIRCTHKLDSPKVAYCNICNDGFYDKRQLKRHLMKVHLNISYTCSFCKKVFKAKESYRRHVLFQHPKNETSDIKCEQCSNMFPNEFELSRHINLEHRKIDGDLINIKKEENALEPFQCTKCSDTYSTWDLLKSHHEASHMMNKECQCQICGEVMDNTDLRKHIKATHTVETLHCKFCEFETSSRTSLTQHVLRHKNATTIHCDFNGCKYKSYFEGAMQKHKRKHEEIGLKLQCTKCPFQSMNKYILKYHEEAHLTGKKRYKCDQCDYATILPANLVQHKYKHADEKRFKCEVCPFATKYNTSLRFHVKKKHCDLPTLD